MHKPYAMLRNAGKNREGYEWCVAWRTPSMPATAFYYYHTREDALKFWGSALWDQPEYRNN